MSRPVLYFVRHGETDWNVQARLQGEQDIPLNATGRRQAGRAADLIRRLRPDFDTLDYVSSPLMRTRETMTLLRADLDLPVEGARFDERLRELAFGEWEGKTWREIRATDSVRARARDADRWNYIPPDGESYAGACTRVGAFLDTIERDSVIVAHGGIARVMLALIAGIPGQSIVQLPIWQGRILVFSNDSYRWFPA
ncbi:histidine phosphatase family protein [Pseudochelatococcus sp. G4_1912]|uniref:histidine phosphatase family protein n=1 Tax=Pseudochelatococcus sp. G4_1912 TaxID=3114288 RepID=UPI0039C6DE91